MNNKLIINRTLLLAFAFVSTILAFFTESLGPTLNTGDIQHLDWLMYFTIWSNIIVFIWASISFVNIFKKSEKLDAIIENWLFKGSATLFIFITGVVFNLLLVPVILIDTGATFGQFLVVYFGFSFMQHVLVPIFMTRDFFLTKGVNVEGSSMKDLILKTLISILVPATWFALSLILISTNVIGPQYFFMNLFDAEGMQLVVNIITLVSIALSWIVIFFAGMFYSSKKK